MRSSVLAATAVMAFVACRRAPVPARSDDAATASPSADAADAAEVDVLAQQVAELEALAAEAGQDTAPNPTDAVGEAAAAPTIVADLRAIEGRVPAGARAVFEAARHRLRRCLAADAGEVVVDVVLVVKEGGEIAKATVTADAGAPMCLPSLLESLTLESPEGGFARLALRLRL